MIKKELWVHETKTAASINPGAVDRLAFDLQIQCYPRLLEEHSNIKPKGVVYNVIRKPQIRQKKNERFDEFIERIAELYVVYPQDYFFRKKILYKKKPMEDAWKDVIAMCEELFSYYDFLEDKVVNCCEWYRNSYSCFDFGSMCPYFHLCDKGENKASLSMFADRKDSYID